MSKTYRGRAPLPRPGGPMRDQRKEQSRRAARGRVNFDGMGEDEDPDAYDRMRDEALMGGWDYR